MKRLLLLSMLLVLGTFLIFTTVEGQKTDPTNEATFKIQKNDKKYDTDSVIVKFKKNVKESAKESLLKEIDGTIKDKNKNGKDDRFEHLQNGRFALIELKGKKNEDKARTALEKLMRKGEIEYVQFNNYHYADVMPNDSSFGSLWGLHNTGQSGGTVDADIDAPEAWETSTGSSDIVVGIIDSGFNYNHPDLAANAWVNPNEIAGNGIDDDGNGYIDDIHGINAITGSGDPMDDNGHGSHCGGTIGGVGNNGIGVTGVNWNVKMVGMKFLDSGGSGSTADALECMSYAIALKNAGVNMKVLNNSWGGGGFEQAMVDALTDLDNAGILFVAAAGNSGTNNDSSPHYPSSYANANVLAVASTDRYDALSSFSCYGATSVDMAAPGSSILSTVLGTSYDTYSGTSMATPHVAGAAALMLSVNDTLTPAEMKSILMDTGDSLAALSGKMISGKRLNLKNAMDQVQPPAPGFNLTSPTGTVVINQGDNANYTIDIASIMGFTGNVNLTASAAPSLNGTFSFSPNPAAVGGSAVLTVSTAQTATVGDYVITINGVSGSVTDSLTVNLKVRPYGTVELSYTNNTAVAIPDNNAAGITSTIDVPDGLTISAASVYVNITHTYIGDLLVKITSPNGTESILHNRSGGSDNDIDQTFGTADFNGENASGTWTLFISDNAGVDTGTLNTWTLTLTGVGANPVLPVADFAASVVTIVQGGSVSFTDQSSGNPTSWAWTFNGGTPASSTLQNPSVAYNTPGIYDVTLTATNVAGSDTTTKTGYITVNTIQPPVADFSASVGTVTAGGTVVFTDQSINGPTSWSWSFQGGTPATSSQQNPSVVYNTAGTYNVSLTVANAAGNDSITKNGYITVTEAPIEYCASQGNSQRDEWIGKVVIGDLTNASGASPYSDFTTLQANVDAGGTVSVTLTPTYSGTLYNEVWTIWIDYNHDGDFTDSGEQVFTASGNSPVSGSFTVPVNQGDTLTRMRVTMKYNAAATPCETFTYGEVEDYSINISAISLDPPVAAFSALPTTTVEGGTIAFTDESTNYPDTWSWSFQGGTPASSSAKNPNVVYNTPGVYSVTLTVSNSAGNDSLTKNAYITITEQTLTYCDSYGTNQNDEWIGQVKVGNLTNTSGPSPYTDYTGMTALLTAGGSVSVTLTPAHSGYTYTEAWRIWIDYNQDGDFDDVGEQVFSQSSSSAVSGSFTVPASAVGVTTRMRVSMKYSSAATPCQVFTYGEVEDYTVTIQ